MLKSAAIEIMPPGEAAPPASMMRERAWLVQATVAHVTGVAFKDLCASTRKRPKAAFARQIAMYLCHVVFAMSLSDVARTFGRDPSTVAHAFRRIEELRDDPEIDRMLTWLEAMLPRAARLS
jgi:chromosomal replication initiation ATPase DnaA